MKTKTWVVLAIAIAGLVVFVFGKETLSYLSGARRYSAAAVKERIPTDLEIARLKSMLDHLENVIQERREALVEVQLRTESLEQELQQRRRHLTKDEALLRQVAGMLEAHQDIYLIGDTSYTHAEVDADALIKAERFRQDRDLLAVREKALVSFKAAIEDGRKTVSDAEVERQVLANAVESLELRAEQLKTVSLIDARGEGGHSLGDAYRDLQHAIGELEHRLAKGERLLDLGKVGVNGIDYAKATEKRSGLEALREVLQ